MAQIAVTILDPSNNRSAHLVETQLLVRDIIPLIVKQLNLPEQLTYQVLPLGSENALPADKTLEESGIAAGAELQLKLIGDQILPKGALGTQIVTPATTASTTASTTVTPSDSGGVYQLFSSAVKGSGLSLWGITLMFVGVLIAGSIMLVGTVIFLPGILSNLADQLGIQFPNTETLGTGDVQVTLRWVGEADLDLHVIDPNGEEVSYETPQSSSGGILDADANGECQGEASPVENIYWPTGEAPDGTYEVYVVYYASCGYAEPVDYEVTITLDGEVMDVLNAQMTTEQEEHPVTIFYY